MVYSSYRLQIDLVLTDVDMPQMNGIELAARIRARDPSKRILLMSGPALDNSRSTEKYPMLPKPFLAERLVAAVDSALRRDSGWAAPQDRAAGVWCESSLN